MEKINVAFLSLGSNLGDRESQITQAIESMSLHGINLIRSSSFFYSEPMGFDSENNFCNMCVKVSTALEPLMLLNRLKSIEREFGRAKKSLNQTYEDRVIDIDLIFYNQISFHSNELTLPHPQWNKRPFVYWPLLELVESLNI
ncbi:MAG: 2-amino-4-hydroxy-6-hydroxymethyldihydropteridine diphosphokinase [Bacteroidota bacterium]|jgi:2-amino-4-hydroxy-6-hydroxymethyldihydropteridine diphosphokinase